jgi:hypothetical protein
MAIPNGTKVISRTNNYDDPLIIGVVRADYRKEINCQNFVPLIEKEDGTEVFSMGITVPYDDLLYEKLMKMDGKSQWNLMVYLQQIAYPEVKE